MRILHRSLSTCVVTLFLWALGSASAEDALNPRDKAQRQVVAYLAKLADIHCTEEVVQEKLARNGHVDATERSRYDYLIMMQGDEDGLQLNESRIEASTTRHKPLPMLVTNGFSTMLLVFHPYYRDSFQFDVEPEETLDGRRVLPMRFTAIPGKRMPAVLALRGREYPLDLQGTAWLDRQSGAVLRIDARLLRDMNDVGLSSMNVHVEYSPVVLGLASGTMMLPSLATVDVETPRQHWRNSHLFTAYRFFSTDAEQDPHVKVRSTDGSADKDFKTKSEEKP